MSEIIHAKLRGVIGAMAMTGFRVFALHVGLIREDPPSRLVRKQKGRKPRWIVELVHWGMGGVFGIVYALLPQSLRQRGWTGPIYGVFVWLGFETFVAPLLGLKQRDWPKGRERLVFLADHLLFGFVLDEFRSQPRE